MRKLLLVLIFCIGGSCLMSQNLKDLSFGTNETFEVMTWNIEWFPKNGQNTVDSVIQVIKSLDVDVLALQEISDTVIFKQMMDMLSDYEGYFKSSWFAGLAYIYKINTVDINDIYEIYTTSQYWSAFPRSPMVMELTFMNEPIIIINNHFKCCGDGILNINDSGDEETRRLNASNLLKQYIDTNFPNDRVIVLGDLNDILTDNQSNNVFQSIIDDAGNYMFADMEIAEGSNTGWSYPGWPSHIDHIFITNELFEEFANDTSDIQTVKIDEHLSGGFSAYDSNISDHRPVALKIKTSTVLNRDEFEYKKGLLKIYPNPAQEIANITFEAIKGNGSIDIYNSNGQKIESYRLDHGQSYYILHAQHLHQGIYYIRLRAGNKVMAVKKLVLIR